MYICTLNKINAYSRLYSLLFRRDQLVTSLKPAHSVLRRRPLIPKLHPALLWPSLRVQTLLKLPHPAESQQHLLKPLLLRRQQVVRAVHLTLVSLQVKQLRLREAVEDRVKTLVTQAVMWCHLRIPGLPVSNIDMS